MEPRKDKKVLGKDILLKVENQVVAHAKSHTLDISVSTIDTADKDSGGWSDALPGIISWSISMDALVNYGENKSNFLNMFWGINAAKKVVVVFETEGVIFNGEALITSLSQNAPNGEIASWSTTLTGTGQLMETHLDHPPVS